MPTVLRHGGSRFSFYSHETGDPPHVHVDSADMSAKFWLAPVALARNFGFSARELNRLHRLVRENRELLLEAWHVHFGTTRWHTDQGGARGGRTIDGGPD